MTQHVIRHNDLLCDFYVPDGDNDNGIVIIYCPGVPNKPSTEDMGVPLSGIGFTILHIRYPGTWQSYGRFSPENSFQGVLDGVEFIQRKQAKDLVTGNTITWTADHIVLIGSSFGGGVALSALALSDQVASAVIFCPSIDPTLQNKDRDFPEDDLDYTYYYLKKCHENTYRGLDRAEWTAFMNGRTIIYPPRYMDKLSKRKLLLIHGKRDTCIHFGHSERFIQSLREKGSSLAEILLVDNTGHGRLLRQKTFSQWTKWIGDRNMIETIRGETPDDY